MEYYIKRRNFNLKWLIISFVLILSLLFSQYVINSASHPFKKHALEVQSAMECLDAKGSNSAYKFYKGKQERRFWTCFDNINWYIIITTAVKRGEGIDREYDEVTAYELNGETIEEFDTRITSNGYATPVDDQLEAHELFFELK